MNPRSQPVPIAASLARVRERIERAARQHGRDPAAITLIAVSKTKPVAAVAEALDAGQRDFGENYVQDAQEKIDALAARAPWWHFVGDIQSNKTRAIAAAFDWAHSVDRLKIARRLSDQRPTGAAPLNLCLQVNLDGARHKSGVAPEAAGELADQVTALDNVRLRGLMTLPEPAKGLDAQRRPFEQLAALQQTINAAGHALDTLSMGMTADLEAAIAAGATCVRVGTAIFGPRQ